MYFKTADVAGLKLFYREAGDPSKPAIVLLHGFPSSSYQFHDFRVIAPELASDTFVIRNGSIQLQAFTAKIRPRN
jgi:pimeloyl-ACP methyl ester carboxylesterase